MMKFGLHDDRQQGSTQSWRKCSERHSTLRRSVSEDDLFGKIDDNWHEAAERHDFSKLRRVRALTGELTVDNFVETLSTLLMMEEAHDAISQRRFDMFRQNLRVEYNLDYNGQPTKTLKSVELHVDGLSNGQPSLVRNDYVILSHRDQSYKVTSIRGIRDDLITLPSNRFVPDDKFLSDPLDVFFVSCGPYSHYEKALERFADDSTIRSRLFEGRSVHFGLDKLNYATSSTVRVAPEVDESFKTLNELQQKAVLSILDAKCWPKPYILFGPPGTGKTQTLAETIGQIYARKPSLKILYCANSNTCVDQMVARLSKIPFIEPADIKRLFAGESTDGIGMKRIILTTNMKSSTLMDEISFDYVIVDEAGHSHEPETLLPISCLNRTGCLVLAGDPKQLGPVVQCGEAEKYGLAKSMLERIFDLSIYQRDQETKKYNSDYITKLLVSYRCDPRVLAISNELFYEGELEFANETPKSLMKMMRITNPLQFIFVRGNEETPRSSTSRINTIEADTCVGLIMRLYKMGVAPDQIGVISPYKLQSKIIKKKLTEGLRSSKYFFEERFPDYEFVKRAKREVKSVLPNSEKKLGYCLSDLETESSDSDTDSITFNLEELKLWSGQEFDSGEQDEVREVGDAEYEWVIERKDRKDGWLCKIDSVDAYQGNEREIIIISTVRTPTSGKKDFIDEPRRFNVAISRAKWLVIVLGHKRVLEDLKNWSEFVSRASDEASKWPEQSVFDLKHPHRQFKPLFKC